MSKTAPNQLGFQEFERLLKIIKLRYISPYKIIYMINQQQADYFKARNKASGCCSSSSITIPRHQMTKTQRYLSQTMSQVVKPILLNKILEQLSDKFQNILKSGQKESLNVDQNVEKFLIEKVMSEGINLYIYKQVVGKLKKQNSSIAESAMLWATPNTWYARYPNVKLNFLSSETLSNLNNEQKNYAIENNFLKEFSDNLHKQLVMLQRDGKFQELLWAKNIQHIRNDSKLMNFPQNYAFDGSEDSYRKGQIIYPSLKKALITLRSIPFQLNEKMNAYCTISQNNQISFFKNPIKCVLEGQKSSKYTTYCPIGGNCKFDIQFKNNQKCSVLRVQLKQSCLLIVDNQQCNITISSQESQMFLFKSWICTLAKNC